MKDKLEPNMYVRTKNRGIAKFMGWSAYDENKVAIHTYNDGNIEITPVIDKNTIIKASHNIIDLIEVGDYVNELPVEAYYTRYDEEKDDYIKIGIITLEDYWKGTFTSVEDIKSIVTKEQLEAIQYVVK